MTGSTILQISIYFDMFILGGLVVLAVSHFYSHFISNKQKNHREPTQIVHIPPEVKKAMLDKSAAEFQGILNKSSDKLQRDIEITVAELNKRLERLGTEIIGTEMRRYHLDIEKLRETTETAMTGAQQQINQHQEDLKTRMAEKQKQLEAEMTANIKTEQEIMIKNIDTKLADAVISFLTETMQHEVDLGSQSKYLIAMLDEHKDEIKKGVSNEA